MKIENVFSTLFIIAIIFVFLGLVLANVDVFMWSAAIGDVIGIMYVVCNTWFNEFFKRKVW